ncbi:class I SAM-dependent methyltransferase [Pantanalinema sp. GBBB05]|uniref:class I SAM-dependent methyltransferase n=1 Tax=Pantanalinema sp. GBBB05 TaxID=2604139 RepID=UPI001D5FF7B1|nr:methyltransferase domain-containing protein [Pantanalinema sp. GBBB05]
MLESKVRTQYNQVASIYDQRWNSYISNTLSFLKTWADLPPTATVLDIACGTGELERLILAEHPTQPMVGVDISEQMLEVARQKLQNYPNIKFELASASALPFDDVSFDTVISANSFHYFDDPNIALKEMKRVLKPNGNLIILDWCRDFLVCRVCDWILQRIDPAHQQCYTQAEFHQFLSRAGFCVQQSSKIRFGLIWGLMVATAMPYSVQSIDA